MRWFINSNFLLSLNLSSSTIKGLIKVQLCFLQISFSDWFIGHGGNRSSIKRMWDPIAYALGFIDCDNISARCMLTIFAFFATKTEASLLRMLNGSPDLRLSGPISQYIKDKGGRLVKGLLFTKSAEISLQAFPAIESRIYRNYQFRRWQLLWYYVLDCVKIKRDRSSWGLFLRFFSCFANIRPLKFLG